MNKQVCLSLATVLFLLFCFSSQSKAQYLRTSFLMDDSPYRMQLNPSLLPSCGYVLLPAIGSMNASVITNSLGIKDVVGLFRSPNTYYDNADFIGRLEDNNRFNVSCKTNLFSIGWYKGQNFWSVNMSLAADFSGEVPKSMFEYLRDVNQPDFNLSNKLMDIQKGQLLANSFYELGMGYARSITPKLTIGANAKLLLGVGNLNYKVNQIKIDANLPENLSNNVIPENWQQYYANLDIDATMEFSYSGDCLSENNSDPNNTYVDDVKLNKIGISGYGASVDLGLSYQLTNELTLSASLIDLGFINWPKKNTTFSVANENINLDGKNYSNDPSGFSSFVSDAENFYKRTVTDEMTSYDLVRLKKDEPKSRTTSLSSTAVFGAEYAFFNRKLLVGALSTTRFIEPKTLSEVTLSTCYQPKKWLNLVLSYSLIQDRGKSFGLAMKLGPVFFGTDYMFLGGNSKTVNSFLGVSFPLNSTKTKE